MYFLRYKDRQTEVARLETQLARAKLEALKIPLRPHFFFNTLHAVSTLIQCDAKGANTMINRLSDLLRFSLENLDRQEVPMEQEIEFLNRYLDIERIRFGDQLSVEVEIDDEVRSAFVPTLILQPIVENAVNHGMDPSGSDGRIRLIARRNNDMLCIDVCDNGPGRAEEIAPEEGGIGLKNTRARLEQLYGSRGGLTLSSSPEGGLKVRIALPFHTRIEYNGARQKPEA
jgi:sensor histidine kinase YesM